MKGTTLGQVAIGSSFWFGNVRFEKGERIDDDGLISCKIFSTDAIVHITDCAWVYIEQ